MPSFFLKKEDKWLRTIANDYARFRAGEQEAGIFLDKAVGSWTECFAYRHPRLSEHIPHAEQEEGLVQSWGDYGKLVEKMRHRLTWTKDPRFKRGRAMPAGQMSGLIEVHETLEGLRAKLKGEGYLLPGFETPYSRDRFLKGLAIRTASRLALYPDVDFATCTQSDRDRSLLDLPGDIEDILELLYANTGAEIYVIAAWRSDSKALRVHHATMPRSARFLSSTNADTVRTHWIQFQQKETWHQMSTGVNDAAPSVYGAFDGSYKPRLPIWSPSLTVANRILKKYLQLLWIWQGGDGEVPWEAEQEDDGPRPVLPSRLPPDLPRLTNPDGWDHTRTRQVWEHLRLCQDGIPLPSKRFQFNLPQDDGVLTDELRETLHPQSTLYYDAPSRLYVTRILANQPNDMLVQCELTSQLPPLNPSVTYHPLSDAAVADSLAHSVDDNVRDLLGFISDYELAGPVLKSRGSWSSLYSTSLYIPEVPPETDSDVEYLGGWWLPEGYFARSEDSRWSMSELSHWLRSGLWMHSPTGTLFGGPYGLKWPVLLLARALWSLDQLQKGRPAPFAIPAHDFAAEIQIVRSDLLWLASELDESCRKLMSMRKGLPDITMLKPDVATTFSMASRYVKPPFAPFDPDSARADSPMRGRKRGKGILKKKPAPSIQDRVEVVLPTGSKRARIGGATTRVLQTPAGPTGGNEEEGNWLDEKSEQPSAQPDAQPVTPKKAGHGSGSVPPGSGSGSSSGRPRKRT